MQNNSKQRFLILSLVALLLFAIPSFGQLSKIENRLPESVPLDVEFRNYGKENWWRDMEIEVKNTGPKPIYYLWLILWLDVNNPHTHKQDAISFKFGDSLKFYPGDSEAIASANDPAIMPGDSYTFRVPQNYVQGWDLRIQELNYIEPRKAKLDHGGTRFGDGTGLESGGSSTKKKRKASL